MSISKQLGLVPEHADEARINHTTPYPAARDGMRTRRWPREVLEAIVDEDTEKLREALAHPAARINTRVRGGPLGVPMRYGEWGFFDERSKAFGVCLFERVEPGDNALQIALRNERPRAALALMRLGIDASNTNDAGESAAVIAHRLIERLRKLEQLRDSVGIWDLAPRN